MSAAPFPTWLEPMAATQQIDEPPFVRGGGLPRVGVHWVRPELVVQVAFMEWTKHGKLRHPRLLGLREDKDARDVTRETA